MGSFSLNDVFIKNGHTSNIPKSPNQIVIPGISLPYHPHHIGAAGLHSRLAALVPKPRVNLTRFHGVFAHTQRNRDAVVGGRSVEVL